MSQSSVKGKWALVLGASSGFGEAISLKLSELGMNIAGIHMDRKTTQPHAEEVLNKIKANGVKAMFINMNAADKEKRAEALATLKPQAENGVHTLVHSLAFGSLKPFVAPEAAGRLSEEQMDMTCNVMAHSLVYWVQALVENNMLQKGGRIFAMTSSGGTRVWPTYGAVSAAKAALESHCRQLALELAPMNVAVNAIRAGVTDTPALRKIPGNDVMIEQASARNPYRRLTTPQDVAACISLLVQSDAHWLTGNTLGVDGGEDIVG